MNPEKLVPTQETCYRAQKLGWKKETYFVWFSNLFVTGGKYAEELYADYRDSTVFAPTLHEVLEEIVVLGNDHFRKFSAETGGRMYWEASINDWDNPQWYAGVGGSINIKEDYLEIFHENPAEAALQLWCKLQERTAI